MHVCSTYTLYLLSTIICVGGTYIIAQLCRERFQNLIKILGARLLYKIYLGMYLKQAPQTNLPYSNVVVDQNSLWYKSFPNDFRGTHKMYDDFQQDLSIWLLLQILQSYRLEKHIVVSVYLQKLHVCCTTLTRAKNEKLTRSNILRQVFIKYLLIYLLDCVICCY